MYFLLMYQVGIKVFPFHDDLQDTDFEGGQNRKMRTKECE